MTRSIVLLLAVIALAGCKNSGTSSNATDPFFGRTRVEPPRTGEIYAVLPTDPSYSAAAPGNPLRPAGLPTATSPAPSNYPAPVAGNYQPPNGNYSYGAGSPGTSNPVPTPAPAAPTPARPGDTITIPAAARNLGDPPSGTPSTPMKSTDATPTNPPWANSVAAASSAAAATSPSTAGAVGGPTGDASAGTTRLVAPERIVRVLEPRSRPSAATQVGVTGQGGAVVSASASALPEPAPVSSMATESTPAPAAP